MKTVNFSFFFSLYLWRVSFLTKSYSNRMKICDNYLEPFTKKNPKFCFCILTIRCRNWRIKRDTLHFKGWIDSLLMTMISQNTGIYRGCIFVGDSVDVHWVVQNWFRDVIGCYNVFSSYRLILTQNDCLVLARKWVRFGTKVPLGAKMHRTTFYWVQRECILTFYFMSLGLKMLK